MSTATATTRELMSERSSHPDELPADGRGTDLSETASPAAHLSPAQIEAMGAELEELRREVMSDLGSKDAAYIRRVIRVQRSLELSSRVVLLFSIFPPAWILGTAALSVAKILENMEIGHNVLHGQWDWMRDPKIHSTTWEWDATSPAKQWQRSHNEEHHTFTNIIGHDDDLGYGIMRVDPKQRWEPAHLVQPISAMINAMVFELGIAAYDVRLLPFLNGEIDRETFTTEARQVLRKLGKQIGKDYVLHPLLSGPSALHTLAANAVANLIRNLWSNAVIICGHFPDQVQVFDESTLEGETRGRWFLRQMLGSANISGGPLLHLLSGNLSHQIEHHLFPDMPSNRLAQVAPRVREIFERNGLEYVTGPMHRQLAQVWSKIFRLSLPNPEPGRSRVAIVAGSLAYRVRRAVRRARAQVGGPQTALAAGAY